MDKIVHELLTFYQKELRETKEGKSALEKLGITDIETIDHFGLEYSTGKAFEIAGKEQRKLMRNLELASNNGDTFKNAVVIPVTNPEGILTGLYGLKMLTSQIKAVNWPKDSKGIINSGALNVYDEVILTDYPLYAVQTFQLGYKNVIAIPDAKNTELLKPLLEKFNIQRVFILSRIKAKVIAKYLTGIETVILKAPKKAVSKEMLLAVDKAKPIKAKVTDFEFTGSSAGRLTFKGEGIYYHVDAANVGGLGMKTVIKAESNRKTFIDRVDLASSPARVKFAKGCASRFMFASKTVELHLDRIAVHLDEMELEEAESKTRTARNLSKKDKQSGQVIQGIYVKGIPAFVKGKNSTALAIFNFII